MLRIIAQIWRRSLPLDRNTALDLFHKNSFLYVLDDTVDSWLEVAGLTTSGEWLKGWIPEPPHGPMLIEEYTPFVMVDEPVKSHLRISQLFGENPKIYAKFGYHGHDGIDIATPVGTPIYAASDGKVVHSRYDESGYGNYVKIIHDWGDSLYAHLMTCGVSVGDTVTAGQEIGFSGNTGFSFGPHLHFSMRPNGADRSDGWNGNIDPLPHIRKKFLSLPVYASFLPFHSPIIAARSMVVVTPVNFRSLSGEILSVLPEGTYAHLSGESVEFGGLPYHKIRLGDGREGWIALFDKNETPLAIDRDDSPFGTSFRFVVGEEGGVFTLDGYTKFGINQRYNPNIDVRSITFDDAEQFYWELWLSCGADSLDLPLAVAHFDATVNMGQGESGRLLRLSKRNLLAYLALRYQSYRRMRNYDLYGQAWMNRMSSLIDYSKEF